MSATVRVWKSSEADQVRVRSEVPRVGDAGHIAAESLANLTPTVHRAYHAWLRQRQLADTESTSLPPLVKQSGNRRRKARRA